MMSNFEKVERDGAVAVLYSPGFGAGWYSWNSEHPGLLFDKDIVTPLLNGDTPGAVRVAEEKYPGIYAGGGSDLKIEWVPKGRRFEIDEYDGNERVRVFEPDDGHVA